MGHISDRFGAQEHLKGLPNQPLPSFCPPILAILERVTSSERSPVETLTPYTPAGFSLIRDDRNAFPSVRKLYLNATGGWRGQLYACGRGSRPDEYAFAVVGHGLAFTLDEGSGRRRAIVNTFEISQLLEIVNLSSKVHSRDACLDELQPQNVEFVLFAVVKRKDPTPPTHAHQETNARHMRMDSA